MTTVAAPPFARSLEIEALMTAARWPNAALQVTLLLMSRLAAAHRFAEGSAFFAELAQERPTDPLPLAAAGFLQSHVDGQLPEALSRLNVAAALEPGLANLLRGLALARNPAAGQVDDAIADLTLVVALPDRFPPGLRRAAYRGLAALFAAAGRTEDAETARTRAGLAADLPPFIADSWVTDRDGFRFVPPRFLELVPGVHVAQGYDFSDISFVTTETGIVAIDAGSTPANAAAALESLRAVTQAPITHVILTHAHWDHIGGLSALRGPDTEVIAQANFARELAVQADVSPPWHRFLPAGGLRQATLTPDRTVDSPTTLVLGGLEFALTPIHGGETDDALLIHLPRRRIVFAGDMLMPYLGGPSHAEGSAEGLFAAMRHVESLSPDLVVHGHPPLTDNFPAAVFPTLRTALESLYDTVRTDLRAARPLIEILARNHLPELLRDHPATVIPYLVLRDNLIKRVHRQRTGYWQPDGEGIEDIPPDDWSLALDLLASGSEHTHATTIRQLLTRDHLPLALRLTDLALRRHPTSTVLTNLRQETLLRLTERHQNLSPFKFVIYSELAGLDLPRPDL
jgi:glyoxylase-like metal-dependent hydrolase (beta-lactamase superfamily II)